MYLISRNIESFTPMWAYDAEPVPQRHGRPSSLLMKLLARA